jgi:hypothetical protein
MGSIAEEEARAGRFRMSEDERIKDKAQENPLLLATVEDLLRHKFALRAQEDAGPYPIFPSQLTPERLDLPDPEGKTVTLGFEGAVLNIYATLAVRLSHSGIFTKEEMWKNAIIYTVKEAGKYYGQIQQSHLYSQASSETPAHLHDTGAPERPVCPVTCILVRYARVPLPCSRYHADVV